MHNISVEVHRKNDPENNSYVVITYCLRGRSQLCNIHYLGKRVKLNF